MKTCFKCLQLKELSDFHKHPRMADGHLNKCKVCARIDALENKRANIERHLAYGRSEKRKISRRAYVVSDRGREKRKEFEASYRQKTAVQVKARQAVSNAIRSGRLVKSPCCMAPDCFSEERVEAHHTNYSEPLIVVWLCKRCHERVHLEHDERQKKFSTKQ